jgi:hypothetical protein
LIVRPPVFYDAAGAVHPNIQPRINANERESEKGSIRINKPAKQRLNEFRKVVGVGDVSGLVFFRFAFIRVNPRLNFKLNQYPRADGSDKSGLVGMHFALLPFDLPKLFDNETCEEVFVIRQRSVVRLREQAVEALQTSTAMLKQGLALLNQGSREAAHKLLNEARAKRNDSVWLMAKANELEKASDRQLSPQPYPAPPSNVQPR